MNNRLENQKDNIVGKIKETTGKVLDDNQLELKGNLQSLRANVMDKFEDVKDDMGDKFKNLRETLEDKSDNFKDDFGNKAEDFKDDLMDKTNHLLDKAKVKFKDKDM